MLRGGGDRKWKEGGGTVRRMDVAVPCATLVNVLSVPSLPSMSPSSLKPYQVTEHIVELF